MNECFSQKLTTWIIIGCSFTHYFHLWIGNLREPPLQDLSFNIRPYVKMNKAETRFLKNHLMFQGSPNQAKWATSSPWFQWNRPISVKKRSFSHPVSLFKSAFFSPIIILFLQCSHKRSSHVPEIWPIQDLMFNILFQTR
jgi:hypothetical protein